jgi:hypothetical protein
MQYPHTYKTQHRLGQTPPFNINEFADQQQKLFESALNGTQALQAGIGRVVDINTDLGNALLKITQNVTVLETRYKDLNSTFGITSKQSAKFGVELDGLATELDIGGKTLIQYTKNLRGIGSGFLTADKLQTKFQKNLLLGQRYMIGSLGVTEKAAEGYEYYAATLGKAGVDQALQQSVIAERIEATTGMQGVQRDLTDAIGNLTADLQIQYSKIPGSLELAILKSRALGMSMEQLNKTGQHLLNIESSIGEEIEYQLLSGRRLVDEVSGESLTNAYRQATMQGNANEQARIMNQILQQEGDILNTNMFARQQMAKLLGTDEATLGRSLQKQKLIAEIGAQQLLQMQPEDFDTEIAKLKEESKNDAKRTEKINELIKLNDTRTTDQLMLEQIEILNSNIIKAITGKLEKTTGITAPDIVDVTRDEMRNNLLLLKEFQGALTDIKFVRLVGGIQNAAVAYDEFKTKFDNLINVIPGATNLVTKLGSAFASIMPATAIAGVAISTFSAAIKTIATAGGVPTVTGYTSPAAKVDDGVIQFNPADKFLRVNDSTMIAGTNVNGNQALANAITQTNAGGISDQQISKLAGAIAAAMQTVNITIEAPLGSETSMNRGTWS